MRDFASGVDQLLLSSAIFPALAQGALAEAQFASGAGLRAALDDDDRIVYDSLGGALYYDADGVGGVAAVQFAVLGTGIAPALAAADLVVGP